jgi:hypothetical protein
MDKTIGIFSSREVMKAEEYWEWQALPSYERLNAVYQLKDPKAR